jgi:hypothetical protein
MYRDLVLPVKQALLEVSRGLSLLAQAAQGSYKGLEQLVAQLAAFPRFPGAKFATRKMSCLPLVGQCALVPNWQRG